PVIHVSLRSILGVKLKYRHELDRRDTQLLNVRDLLDQTGKRTALGFCDSRIRMTGETAHVHLVDDRLSAGTPQRAVSLPVVRVHVDDSTLHGRCGVLT